MVMAEHRKLCLSSLCAALSATILQLFSSEVPHSLATSGMSVPFFGNASKPPEDKNKKNTEIWSWNDPKVKLFFKHCIILRDSHFGGQKVVADGMEEVMKCMVVWSRRILLSWAIQVDDGENLQEVVRDAEGMPGLRRFIEANGWTVRKTALTQCRDARTFYWKPKEYGERMSIRHFFSLFKVFFQSTLNK